ncbi:hypothetical protein L2E68_22610 [Planktothrix agardhii 1029]|uniref:hypothetical protein n=1 Tax=Planktothrix agardhii TaxID=1160 RepID=UPI001D0A408C|nr:hypothetical protein [Planktothrix agardhii]MCB8766602.1 hypothetical protein [Planktothrix agardhii 1809]MCB8780072.1 hypothetical protein [Planktothrix agardhii 1031]MCB8784547.1 hypothetical protein [Planktothrix agardhii 1808]MCF3568802.1 hypothetical protein [Planktothrix agardhii 1807]MCF3577769.1 hypothetical protein [Planktothrix agardhii 1812]
MPSNSSPLFTTQPENSLREKLIRSIWLHRDKYCYLFEPDGSYRLLSTDRRGQYTILPDGRSVLLAWTTDPFTETLCVQEDGSLLMSGSAFIEIGTRSEAPSQTANPLPQPDAMIPSLIPEEPSQSDVIPYWLPEDFRVFTSDSGIVGIASGGGQEVEPRILPTVNQYKGADGGYVAFYSRDPAKAVYSVGGGIYVVGQIRLKGRYIGRIFHPEGYLNQDISAVSEFKTLCCKTFGVEGWAGGDTGGWFARVNSSPEVIGDRSNSNIDTAPVVHPAWKQVVTEGTDFLLAFIRIRFLLPLMVLLSPTLFILWGAFARFGLTWRLMLIPVGGIVGFVLMAIIGMYWCNYNFELHERQTGPSEAGSFGGLGQAIMAFIVMALLGWIGSGLGAWLVASYWVGGF